MSLDRMKLCAHRSGFPRVSGDEPPIAMGFVLSSQFSPRERG